MIITFVAGFFTTVFLDIFWIFFASNGLYTKHLGSFLRLNEKGVVAANIPSAIALYILLVIGSIVFVLPKADSASMALLYGAIFGLVVYGVYEFTNYSLISGWPIKITIIDTLWGMVICGITALVVFLVHG